MNHGETVAGQRKSWSLVQKLGEGDAGEVYRVEALLDRRVAILKRPHRSTFTSDMLRQAGQINTEARILKALEGLLAVSRFSVALRTPAVFDQSPPGSDFGKDFFIIIEKASGFDLGLLARLAHSGSAALPDTPLSPEESLFLNHIAQRGQIPELILLRSLTGVLELIERLHHSEVANDTKRQAGVIWNDVKADHLFWDPATHQVTIIDWGNGQFLEGDGVTQDRRYSRMDDYIQFMREMGKFLHDTRPDLVARLEWPLEITPGNAYTDGIRPVKERLTALLEERLLELRQARRLENDLLGVGSPTADDLRHLRQAQEHILDLGEIPETSALERLYARFAARLAGAGDLPGLRQACQEALEGGVIELQGAAAEKWRLLCRTADLSEAAFPEAREGFLGALHAGALDDWPAYIWELLSALDPSPLPDWWEEICGMVRRLHLGVAPDTLAPYVAASRVYFTLQAEVMRHRPPSPGQTSPDLVLRVLEEEVIKKWKMLVPDPPNAGIQYNDIDSLLPDLEAILPGTQSRLEKSLAQPRAQAELVMESWRTKEFDAARRALRSLLPWDPHRRRVLNADQAMQTAPAWLLRVRQGARKGEAFLDYLSEVEWSGRELRNAVGPARWLDNILETFKQLRSGANLADMLLSRPELLTDIPWLNQNQARETVVLPRRRALTIERDYSASTASTGLRGPQEGDLGTDGLLTLSESLDTWLPEARGSSARVFLGKLNFPGAGKPAAFKVMRPDQIAYATPLFREEAQILTVLRDVPGVTPLLECGFIRLENGTSLPGEERAFSADGLQGGVVRYGVDSVQSFLVQMDARLDQGWLPYLAFPIRDPQHNLIVYCDAGHTRGQFLPLRESLLLSIQICDILQVAHDRNIVYRDHKILHYYWDPEVHGVTSIDWNIARRHPQSLSSADKAFDLVQFGARAFHHIMTGRAAPGSLPLGPNRPEDIEAASHRYRVQWTYDDERLPNRVKEILERSLSEGYTQVRDLRNDLYEVFVQLPESTPA